MTNEEAIKLLVNATYSKEWQGNEELTTAHNMAIQALSQEPILDKLTEIIEPLRHLAFDEMSDVERQILQVIDKYAEQDPCETCGYTDNEFFNFDAPMVKKSMEQDVVSREAVKEIINDIRDCISIGGYCAIVERLKKLPPVTQKQETGHWFVDERPESDREIICSNCEQPIFKYHKMDFDYRPKYCPNCGAKMQESEV